MFQSKLIIFTKQPAQVGPPVGQTFTAAIACICANVCAANASVVKQLIASLVVRKEAIKIIF
jgi:hypothetical protein